VDVAVLGGAVTFIDASGQPFGNWRYPLTDAEIRKAFAHTTPLAHPAVMVRKDAVSAAGGYRPLLLDAEDIDLWLRIADRHELANLPDIVIRYRVHQEQATVRGLEMQTLCSVAARLAARARSEGRPDPLDATDRIDYELLLAMGATGEEITSALVHNTTWLAKTVGRAGDVRASEQLFDIALSRARSKIGSWQLAAYVHREHAHRYREQRRRLRFALETLRALRAERSRKRR